MITPTPEPISGQAYQLFQQMLNSYNNTVQQQAIGVLQFIGFTTVILAAAIFIFVWSRRNTKPVDPTAGTNAAITALAEQLATLNEQRDEIVDAQKEENKANREQHERLTNKYIESMTVQSDAMNRLVDTFRKEISENQSFRVTSNNTAVENNSLLQQVIKNVANIETMVKNIKDTSDLDQGWKNTILTKLSDIEKIASNIERRSTSEIKKVAVESGNTE